MEIVYDSKWINELGFVRDELSLSSLVSEDTERHLFEKLGRGKQGRGRPQDYKEEMLVIMEAFMEQITKQGEIHNAIKCCECTKSFGNNTILE